MRHGGRGMNQAVSKRGARGVRAGVGVLLGGPVIRWGSFGCVGLRVTFQYPEA